MSAYDRELAKIAMDNHLKLALKKFNIYLSPEDFLKEVLEINKLPVARELIGKKVKMQRGMALILSVELQGNPSWLNGGPSIWLCIVTGFYFNYNHGYHSGPNPRTPDFRHDMIHKEIDPETMRFLEPLEMEII